jgi:hypothetical protein
VIATIAILTVLLAAPPAAMPAPETTQAFDRYIAVAEARIGHEEVSVDSFLALPSGSATASEDDLRGGEVVISATGPTTMLIPGGLIHDWTGAVLVPHASVSKVLRIVQDYNHLAGYYAPALLASRLISRDGDDFHIFLRMREHKVITVVLDSEYDVHYGRLDSSHQFSFSRSTRVTEIADAGQPNERAINAADNHGYLWRLNTYWRFAQEGDGVIVECEAISLTRTIPTGLGWLIGPYLSDIPRESLRSTLINTREAVEAASH